MSLDVANSVADVVYRLGFVSSAEMAAANSWVTSSELYQWADEAAKRLAVETLAFATFDNSISVAPGTAVYSLPSSHIYTAFAFVVYSSGGVVALRLTAARELWALDGNWQTTSGDARRASLDAGAAGTLTLYPIPIQAGTLAQVLEEFPATIASGSSTVRLPTVMQDFFSYRMLEGAKGKESGNADLAMSAHFGQRADLYSQIAAHLWGEGL